MAPEFEHPWRFEYFFDHLTMTGQILTERQTLLDLLTAKDLAENKVVDTRWVPPYKQHAGYFTKLMLAWLWVGFTNKGNKGLISPRETTEEAQEEDRRRGLRKAQREGRKERMRRTLPSAQTCCPAASGAKSARSGGIKFIYRASSTLPFSDVKS